MKKNELETAFYLQPYLRGFHSPIVVSMIVAIGVAWTLPLVLPWFGLTLLVSAARLSTFFSLTILLMGTAALTIAKGLRITRVIVTQQRVALVTPLFIRFISFENITEFRTAKTLGLRIIALLKSNDCTIHIPFVLDEPAELIKLIRERLVEHGMGHTFDRAHIDALHLQASVSAAVNQRLHGEIRTVRRLTIWLTVAAGYVASHIWGHFAMQVFVWMIFTAVVILGTFIAANFAIGSNIKKALQNGQDPDVVDVAGTYKSFVVYMMFTYLLIGILYRDLSWLFLY